MSQEPPLRAESVDEILSYLRDGTNVNVVGLRAAGRSAVLRHVTARLEADGVPVVRIAGVRALRDRPLSALAVAGIEVTHSPNHLQTLTAAVASLEALLSARPSVLMIDDADDLDAASVGAIVAVHARLPMPVVTTSRPAGRRQTDTRALTAELQPGARVALRPLGFDGVHRLVHELLSGPVDPTAVARIAAKSGGLPGLVRAMVDAGRRNRRLAPREGLWVARGDLWTTSLAQSVEPLLTDLDESDLDALTLLSCAGTLPLDAARRAVTQDRLALLDDVGLLRVLSVGDDTVVGVFPPLVAEFLTHEGSTTHHLWARDRLAAAGVSGHPGAGPGDYPVAVGVPTTVCGAPADDSPAPARLRPVHRATAGPVTRATLGTAGGEPVLNRRLAHHQKGRVEALRATWEADRSPAHGAQLVEALLVARARPHEIDAVLSGTALPGEDQRALAQFVTWAGLYAGLVDDRFEAATKLLHERRLALRGFDGLMRATEGYLRLVVDSVPPSAALDDADDDEDGLSHDALLVVRAESLVAAGRARAALALLDGFESPDARLRQSADVTRELALLYDCDFEAAIASALANVERARLSLDPGAIEAHAYVAALGLALGGRLVELDELTSSVLALGSPPSHQSHFQTGVLTLAAAAAKWQGRAAYARSLAVQAGALRRHRGPHPCMAADRVSALMGDCEDEATADELWALAEERMSRGYLPAGIAAGVASIEQKPDAARAARLVAAATSCDSPLPAHLGAYAVAIASGDPDRLEDVGPRLRDAGLRLYAVRAAVARAVGLHESGDAMEAFELADDAWNQAGLRGRDLCGLFARLDRVVNLTAREREVAVLVARGLSSPEIATAMVLSIRTVENHIFNACRKVGVDTREGLARAARTWLSCASK